MIKKIILIFLMSVPLCSVCYTAENTAKKHIIASPIWVDNFIALRNISEPICVHNGVLWSANRVNAYTAGIYGWDGSEVIQGPKTNVSTMYTTSYGWSLGDLGGTKSLIISEVDSADSSNRYLLRSLNPASDANFSDVNTPNADNKVLGTNLARSLVDCGLQTINNDSNHVVFWFEYGNDADAYYSLNGGKDFFLLFDNAEAIDHYHGGVYVPNIGDGSYRLYVMTGDSTATNPNSRSILMCDDINDLVTNPSTWNANWGLDDRSAWAEDGSYYTDYVLGVGKEYRAVDIIDCNNGYAYYIPDSGYSKSEGGERVMKIDHAAKTVSTIKTGLRGVGWYGCRTSDGLVLISTYSAMQSNYGLMSYSTDMVDEFNRIYAVEPNDDSVTLIKSIRRGDYNPFVSPVIWPYADPLTAKVNIPAFFTFIGEYEGNIWIRGMGNMPIQSLALLGSDIEVYGLATYVGKVINPDVSYYDFGEQLLLNNDFALKDGSNRVTSWLGTPTRLQETVIVPPGQSYSVKSAFTASSGPVVYQAITNINDLKGKVFTCRGWIYIASSDGTLKPKMQLSVTTSDGRNPIFKNVFATDVADETWYEYSFNGYCPTNATAATLYLYAHQETGVNRTGTVYYGHPRLEIGSYGSLIVDGLFQIYYRGNALTNYKAGGKQ